MARKPLLNVVAGVTEMSAAMLQRDDQQLLGIYSRFFQESFKKMRLNVTYEDMLALPEFGECYANNSCTHQLALLQKSKQDFQLMGQPLDFAKFVDQPPLLYGPVFVGAHSYILSRTEGFGQSKNMDVVDSLKNISLGVAALYLFWIIFAWLLSIQFRNILKRRRDIRHQHYFWDILRTFLNQDNFNSQLSDVGSTSIIGLVVIISAFWLIQLYYGFFGTDLTLTPEPFKINTLRHLVDKGIPAAFWQGDTTFDHDFRDNKRSLVYQQVYEMHMRAPLRMLMEPDGTKLAVNVVRNRSYVLIGPEPTLNLVNLLWCMDDVAGEDIVEGYKSTPLHFSTDIISDQIRSTIYHRNISRELRKRLDWGFEALFESHATFTALIDDLAHDMTLIFAMKYSTKLRKCTTREHLPPEPNWSPFRMRNVPKLFRLLSNMTLAALLMFAIECIAKMLRKPKKVVVTPNVKRLREIVTQQFTIVTNRASAISHLPSEHQS